MIVLSPHLQSRNLFFAFPFRYSGGIQSFSSYQLSLDHLVLELDSVYGAFSDEFSSCVNLCKIKSAVLSGSYVLSPMRDFLSSRRRRRVDLVFSCGLSLKCLTLLLFLFLCLVIS